MPPLLPGVNIIGRRAVAPHIQTSAVSPEDRQKLLGEIHRSHARIQLGVDGTVAIHSLGENPTGVRKPGGCWEFLRSGDGERTLVEGMEVCFHSRWLVSVACAASRSV